ncbi:PE-PPE domain-containing protein [Mycobacterium sp. Y57]|uniref:PE-PPE domain-containing protein n=1 Tax=Mycolicibacterium xanthum TaxID=2796469 RepID=UPI001C84A7A9|nr:PE-PPE domain-containing protein [Mycolicibacterium xanthum]MBX7430684.1 PE-PPE domain-containing protein [Mycolicibacterium xanthum]
MSIVGMAAKATSVGCALALVVAGPTAAEAATLVQQPTTNEVLAALMAGDDPALSAAEPSTSSTGWLTGPPFNVPDDPPDAALVVNTPGTDDTTLYKRIDPMRGDLRTVNVVYPESLWPIISGKSGHLLPIFAPTYDQSVAIAVDHNLETMAGLKDASDKPYVVYTGYSQGADALGDAAVQGLADGYLDPATDQIVLVSDPRGPWGVKQFAADHPLVGLVFCLVGATPDGARDPADTGDELQVTSVIIDGDPVANLQWDGRRPISSLVVDAAGFLMIHGARGPESYATLDEIQDVDTLYSEDGRTTYLIYHADHPLTQLTEFVLGVVGIHLSDDQVDKLNTFNDWFYPLQQPTPERAAPVAPVTTAPPPSPPAEEEASISPTSADGVDAATSLVSPVRGRASITPAPADAVETPDLDTVPGPQDDPATDEEIVSDAGSPTPEGAESTESLDEGAESTESLDEGTESPDGSTESLDESTESLDGGNFSTDTDADSVEHSDDADSVGDNGHESSGATEDAKRVTSPAQQRAEKAAPPAAEAAAA